MDSVLGAGEPWSSFSPSAACTGDEDGVRDAAGCCCCRWKAKTARATASLISRALPKPNDPAARTGSMRHAESAKLRQASRPESASAAASWARAAISAVVKVPSQSLELLVPSTRTSHTQRPARPRRRTPRYTGWRVSLNFVRPAGRFGGSDHTVLCGPCSWSDEEAASIGR
ncbi:hypothetical protein ACQ4PT_063388 [Festuca glaucescens]